MLRFLSLTLGALTLCGAAHAAGLLNDTGQARCNNGTTLVTCTAANTGDAAPYPRQDGRFGRDAAAPAKVGGGVVGFDFTKVCQNGTLNCAGSANTTASPAAAEWACTKDNVTNLVWSLESGNGDWTTYASTTLPTATNTANRCGYNSGWRLPTGNELLSIVHFDASAPSIDVNYFPGTSSSAYWTSDTYAPIPSSAWGVSFFQGHTDPYAKASSARVRLVRSGP